MAGQITVSLGHGTGTVACKGLFHRLQILRGRCRFSQELAQASSARAGTKAWTQTTMTMAFLTVRADLRWSRLSLAVLSLLAGVVYKLC